MAHNRELLMYMVYHDDLSKTEAEQIASAYPWIIPVEVPPGKYMESEVFSILMNRANEWKSTKYVGILKHSFLNKTPFYNFHEIIDKYHGMDVYTFVNGQEPPFHSVPMIISAAWSHPLFHVIWYQLLRHMGINDLRMFDQYIPGFYSNYWIARTKLFEQYLHFFHTARQIMDSDALLREIMFENACYEYTKLSEHEHQKASGVGHPTYHCFVAERLACFFFYTIGARICPIGGMTRQIDPSISVLPVIQKQ